MKEGQEERKTVHSFKNGPSHIVDAPWPHLDLINSKGPPCLHRGLGLQHMNLEGHKHSVLTSSFHTSSSCPLHLWLPHDISDFVNLILWVFFCFYYSRISAAFL
jgi:hypothetical protein